MAQKRYLQWKDDDSTFNLNQMYLGIFEAGRYRGFSYNGSTSGMNLVLDQTGGAVKVDESFANSNALGIWISKQGVVITEDGNINLSVSSNTSGDDRIDLIVGTHEYTQAVGGSVATYSIIQGTPATNPTAPNLTFPTKQVILGRLYIPDGTTSLTASMYTPENVPPIASDANIAYLNTLQYFSETHAFSSVVNDLGHGKFDVTNDKIVLGLAPTASLSGWDIEENSNAAFYLVYEEVNADPIPTTYVEVSAIEFAETRDFFTTASPKVQKIHIYSTYPIKFVNGASILTPNGNDLYVDANTPIVLYQPYGNNNPSTGTASDALWVVESGAEMRSNRFNKLRGILSYTAEESTIGGSLEVPRSDTDGRNIIKLANTNATTGSIDFHKIEYIESHDYTQTGDDEEGTILTIISGTGNGIQVRTAYDGSSAAPSGYKPILNPYGYHMNIEVGGSITVMETADYWVITGVSSEAPYWVACSPGAGFADGNIYIAKIQNVYFLKGKLIHDGTGTIPANCGYTILTLPTADDIYGDPIYSIGENLLFHVPIRIDSTDNWVDGLISTVSGITMILDQNPVLNSSTFHNIYFDGITFTSVRF